MSFSSQVKDELARQLSPARHCQIAELAALISLCGKVQTDENGRFLIRISTENEAVARKYFTLLKKTFNISTDIVIRQNVYLRRSKSYQVTVSDDKDARRVLMATKLLNSDGQVEEVLSVVKNRLIQNTCCRRAFIRGAFLAAGSISDPRRFYHYEIACLSEAKAVQLKDVIAAFGIDARIVVRKKYHVVYIKEGSQIVEILNVMEAPQSLMELENIRIVKEMRGSVNRQVNCETANINKTVSAAVKQLEDITYIRDAVGFGHLPDGLAEVARARLAMPDATLKELGESLEPPVGKSGVNHRLRKLSNLAEELREKGETAEWRPGHSREEEEKL